MNRRALIKALGGMAILTGSGLSPVLFAEKPPKLLLPPKVTSPLFHVVGTLPEPVEVKRIFTIDESASVAVNSVAPKQLLGWPFEIPKGSLSWLSRFSRQLPVVEPEPVALTKQLVELAPDIIVDVAPVTEARLAQAQQVHEQTGITYVLVEKGQLEDTPEQVRILGAVLGHQRHGQQLAAGAQEVLDKVTTKKAAFNGKAPTVYVAHTDDGLETGLGDDVIQLVGANNAAAALEVEGDASRKKVSMEQVQQWNPDVILTQNKAFYEQIDSNPSWQDIAAVRNEKVFFIPNVPFDWLETPPSVNRLFGALWLSATLHNEDQALLIDELRHLFILYFAYDPGVERLQELLNNPTDFAA